MTATVTIGEREVGEGRPIYVVAEMSANHNGDFDRAARLVQAAKQAGADAIKLQTYTADTLTIDADTPYFRIEGTAWHGRKLHELYAEAATPWAWHRPLRDLAHELDLDFFSTPFDETAVDLLESLEVPAHKVASFEIVDLPLLRRLAATRKPLIVSTGMASAEEIAEALATIRAGDGGPVILLKCTSAYPARAADMHLRTLADMRARFGVPVGLSDHTTDVAVPAAAAALGACVIEKHLTLSRADGGPDAAFSLEPHEFGHMVRTVRTVEQALGEARYGGTVDEAKSRVFRRSLFVVEDVRAGEVFTATNVRVIRPGHGLHPRHLGDVLGRRARVDIERGTPLSWELIE